MDGDTGTLYTDASKKDTSGGWAIALSSDWLLRNKDGLHESYGQWHLNYYGKRTVPGWSGPPACICGQCNRSDRQKLCAKARRKPNDVVQMSPFRRLEGEVEQAQKATPSPHDGYPAS